MDSYLLTNESQFEQQLPAIEAFWNTGVFSSFVGVDQVEIAYAFFPCDKAKATIYISPGRIEGYLKYQELIFDLNQNGYEVAIIDHRGQGLSGRMLSNPDKGYVQDFEHYVEDFYSFFKLVESQRRGKLSFLLAHSMGSAIATRYLQRFPKDFDAAALSSPMIAIDTAPFPKPIAKVIISCLHGINRLFGGDAWYMLGQNGYQPDSFSENKLTHSQTRYQWFREIYEQTPNLKLGGVTVAWLKQALATEQRLFNDIALIQTPIRIIQSGKESIVDNEAQNTFARALSNSGNNVCPDGAVIRVEGAKHELFIEADEYRDRCLNSVLEWFSHFQR